MYDYHAGSDKHAAKYHFKVKDKWLDTSIDFTEGVYYQRDLDLLFYSMDRPICQGITAIVVRLKLKAVM